MALRGIQVIKAKIAEIHAQIYTTSIADINKYRS
jgi:hypothetical protein